MGPAQSRKKTGMKTTKEQHRNKTKEIFWT